MNVYCLTGLHQGVFQAIDPTLCEHTFWVPSWEDSFRVRPENIKILTPEMISDPDDNFFGAILIFPEHYEKVKNVDKTIMVYFVTDGRPGRSQDYTRYVISNPRVVPIFLSTGCRLSHGVYEGSHKTIYHGVDDEFWSGWNGEEQLLAAVKNDFKNRDPQRFDLYKNICGDNKNIVIGTNHDITLGYTELRDRLRTCRAFMNVEIVGSPFDTSCVEAMMLGMPIVTTDSECSGEFIRNGIEGFISNNPSYLKKKATDLMNDKAMAEELGANARKMAQLRFSKKQFNMQWNDVLSNIDSYKRA
jgi:glycosyltransferase involved in cell wall biosynthesis